MPVSFETIHHAFSIADYTIIDKYHDEITHYYDSEYDKCTCENITYKPCECIYPVGSIENLLLPNKIQDSENLFNSFRYVIEKKYIDPSRLFKNRLLLATCIYNYSGSPYDRDRINVLFEFTPYNVIKNFRTFGESYYNFHDNATLLVILNMCKELSMPHENDFYDSIFNKLIQANICINEIAYYINDSKERIPDDALSGFIWNIKLNKLNIMLDGGCDPNLDMDHSHQNNNSAMNLLMVFNETKNLYHIKTIRDIIILLVNRGLNLEYKNTDGRNLMDFIHDYKWYDVPMDMIHIDEIQSKIKINCHKKWISDVNKKILSYLSFGDYLIIKGCPQKTGLPSTNKLTVEELKYCNRLYDVI